MNVFKTKGLPVLVALLLLLTWSNHLRAQTDSRESLYLTMTDGVKVAVDVFLPQLPTGDEIPTVIRSTRYWRAFDIINPNFLDDAAALEGEFWNTSGYALVLIDARGSGASFGSRTSPWAQDEINDLGEITDWITSQNWSNGRVGAYGVSYDGNTAEFTASTNRSAVKVIAPQFSDYDPYTDLAIPGGVQNVTFVQAWSDFNEILDANDICSIVGADPGDCPTIREFIVSGVRPVDADTNRTQLDAAIQQHQGNLIVGDAIQSVVYKDDAFGSVLMEDFSPYSHKQNIEQGGAAYFARAGWFDAGTADGVLKRFHTFNNSQMVIIGPWGHGAEEALDPFHPAGIADSLSEEEQFLAIEAFFAPFLKGTSTPQPQRQIVYYTLNEGAWKTTDVWPPVHVIPDTLYFAEGNALLPSSPQTQQAFDSYTVDFSASNGSGGRWLQDANKALPDRAVEDQKLLTYTSRPLATDLEITGHPEIKLFAKSSASDGTFIVYLEDVAPDGRVTYITEGVLRAIHRKVSSDPPPYHHFGPYHSYLQVDGMPIPAGEVVELHFALQPTSVRLEAGHRIRIAIAGHDASTFERIPESETPTIEVQRSAIFASQLILPVANEIPLGLNGEESFQPEGFSLEQNFPNPFNPSTTFRFRLENSAEVQLKVFDLQGKEVATVVNKKLAAGEHQIDFNASDLASGAYFYQMRVSGVTATRKMMLLK